MANIGWLIKRMQAMSIPEIMWRVSQKIIQKKEEILYKSTPIEVISKVFSTRFSAFEMDSDRLHLNLANNEFVTDKDIHLLGGYDYQEYKMKWGAGFQTQNNWPQTFSYSLDYKQKDEIGDARTNWELNRHFQFALLAKNYYATGSKEYLDELLNILSNWNKVNPFLYGISWTSVMEVAIRSSNWCYTYCFLAKSSGVPQEILKQLRIGIINMTDYIAKHYSRYSSANNHLIVEAYAIGQSGILLSYKQWIDLSIALLTRELPLQNYLDGVNKELSLHYQIFYMEAMGLMMRLMVKNQIAVPDNWTSMLNKMCQYVVDCMGEHGEIVEFGDNDEGKILDLHGGEESHYQYVLGLLSCLLEKRYVDLDRCSENLKWLFDEQEREINNQKSLYKPTGSVCYKEGGNSILRSKDGRVLVGIDHATLGFGSIAAHGHSDALSFQMYVDGQPVFVDPGTYIYHCDLANRNAFRKTENHNTVCIGGKDQSEMIGAFLWGKKAECKLAVSHFTEAGDVIEAEHNGYAPNKHKRRFLLNENKLEIADIISTEDKWVSTLIFAYDISKNIKISDKHVNIRVSNGNISISWLGADASIENIDISTAYGYKEKSRKLCLRGEGNANVTIRITWILY